MIDIFIDESGTFVPTQQGPSISAVGAVVVPSAFKSKLFSKFEKLRNQFPKNKKGEIKGSSLNEIQVDKTLDLLKKNSCVFEASLIDMSREDPDAILRHQQRQASKITEHVTDDFHDEAKKSIWDLRKRLEAAPPQLYVQSSLTSSLVGELISLLPTYFVQRWPNDLDNFSWTLDAKNPQKVTEHEDWWERTICPLLQSSSKNSPMPCVEGLDYSIFDAKYEFETPEYLKAFGFKDKRVINLGLLLRENLSFSPEVHPGLELADIATNALRRAFNGNLQQEGWRKLPDLMIHRRTGPIALRTLSEADARVGKSAAYYDLLAGPFAAGGRSMLTKLTRD